jgi:outer membrane lipoprotein-sorting protein
MYIQKDSHSFGRLFIAGACLTVFLCPAGCSLHRNPPTTPPAALQTATLPELLYRIHHGITDLTSLKCRFSAVITDRRKGTKQSCDGMLAVERPAKLRMKGSAAMLPTLFDLLCTDSEIMLYVPRDKTVYQGRRIENGLGAGVTDLSILSDILWGAQDPPGAVNAIEIHENSYIVYTLDKPADGNSRTVIRRKVTFDRHGLIPVRYRYLSGTGACVRDIHCDNYITVRGFPAPLPARISIDSPADGLLITVELKRLNVNPQLPEALFQFDYPNDVSVHPLEEYF